MISDALSRAKAFERVAHQVLGKHEDASASRLIQLEGTYRQLSKLTIKQDELFRQALRCAENELFRAAHVMAWAGFMDYFETRLWGKGGRKLRAARPNWKAASLHELRESIAEFHLLEAGRDIGLLTKTECKALQGLLNKRNECAHPSDYFPSLNETLGYISELIQRINHLQAK